ncbi:MAG: glycosyltransferase family 39 protein [bacterium]|nr:glycosyltransferase family 39 protein [bacterium]
MAFAFVVRLIGIGYGLPLWLIDDEPPFALAALKMIQLKNPIPAFNLEDFKSVLYYPPYLAYVYILPFLALLGAKFLLFSGPAGQFIYYLTSDLSAFFLTARFLNVLLGVISVWLAYDAAKNLFKDKIAGLAAAFFLATSLTHVMFSLAGRHWLPVSIFYLLGFWLLVNEKWAWEKRYFSALLVTGLGMGVSPITALFLILMAGWYFIYEKRNFGDLIKNKHFYLGGIIFIVLAFLPSILYPASFGFKNDVTLNEVKTLSGLLASPVQFLKPIILSEPILALFAAIGLGLMLMRQKPLFFTLLIFIYGYSGVFYWLFRYEHRFILPLLPFWVITAGFAFGEIKKIFNRRLIMAVFLLMLLLPLAAAGRLGYLAYRNDSRIHLRNWVKENIPQSAKILVYARLTRLPSSVEAIAEQRLIDPGSLRKTDVAEENLIIRKDKYFHALNLYSVANDDFFDSVEEYAKKNQYQYLVISETDFAQRPEYFRHFQSLAKGGILLKSFGDSQETYSLSIGQLKGAPGGLFRLRELGPAVSVYKIK